jgi:hypothetical protein
MSRGWYSFLVDGFVKKAAGKAGEARGVRRTFSYGAVTRAEGQRRIRLFYEAVPYFFQNSGISSTNMV